MDRAHAKGGVVNKPKTLETDALLDALMDKNPVTCALKLAELSQKLERELIKARRYAVSYHGAENELSLAVSDLTETCQQLQSERDQARLALSAASSALGPMENLINPDLRALKAQIDENL